MAGQELPIGTRLVLERGDILRLVGAKRHVERVSGTVRIDSLAIHRHRYGCARACHCDRRLDRLTGAALCRRRYWTERARRNIGRRTRGGLVACAAAAVRPRAGGSTVSAELTRPLRLSGGRRDWRRTDVCGWSAKGRHSTPHRRRIGLRDPEYRHCSGRQYLLELHPGIVLGICAGAGTSQSGLAAVQEAAESQIPTLGYGVSYAIGNILLALCGSLIVAMVGAPVR